MSLQYTLASTQPPGLGNTILENVFIQHTTLNTAYVVYIPPVHTRLTSFILIPKALLSPLLAYRLSINLSYRVFQDGSITFV